MTQRSTRIAPLAWLLGLGACTSVLGIEDLHEGPRSNAVGGTHDGASGSGTQGGNSSSAGTISGGGTGANAGASASGGSGQDAGAGNEPVGGAMPGAAGATGDAGAGGATVAPSGAVHGKLIDRWGAPIANITVLLGNEQVQTGMDGTFTLADVPQEYTLRVLVPGTVWVFQGLTRRDPMLQIYSGRTARSAYLEVTSMGAVLGTNDQLSLAVGAPSGSYEYADIGVDSPVTLNLDWDGPATTAATVHGLLWTKNATTKLPVSYKAFDDQNMMLTDDVDATKTLSMAAKSGIGTGTVTGTATPVADGVRANSVFVRYTSGGVIQIVEDTPKADAFSYVVPKNLAAGTTFTVAAWEGSYYGPLGLVHKDGLAPDSATGALKIPAPPVVLGPKATAVDSSTPFKFGKGSGGAGTFLVIIHRVTTEAQRLCVVTSKTSFAVKDLVDSEFAFTSGAEYEWWVETHGSFASVDAMAEAGFVDEFSMNYTKPVGTHPQDGTYAYTSVYSITGK